MQRAVYLLSFPFLWLVSRLPFPLLYALSDGVFLLVYYLVRYRRKVVRENLKLVFPEKPEAERSRIERRFYAHMCDMFLEMIKTMGMTPEEMRRRFTFSNLELLHRLEDQGKSVMIQFPHYASWEWAIILDSHIRSRGFGIYQPINHPDFDKLIRDIRGKFGMTLITTKQTREVVAQNRKNGILATYGILTDQSPMLKKTHYWAPFMGIEVPMHTGAELLCKQLDLPAIYLKVTKIKRGYYHGECILLSDNPSAVPDYQITDMFFRETERAIREAPEYYFWTHKRWKHRGKKDAARA
ncbi:lipid A biosynthesis acyltransferase [Robiginitalea sp. M366]|uniref:lysophospholipid acyltransferase family protein n=1 Tax=Robiginitalea aestuariiviva TaxID=3036903 RepID=UPI00240D8DE6|nr:lipid A biosynthesis acyltransferase [Robiginitalea aestuariiviva]MDG1572869.1 lipid A biosynthesis acyltransferase [Robiginitalea aestuariiviva]